MAKSGFKRGNKMNNKARYIVLLIFAVGIFSVEQNVLGQNAPVVRRKRAVKAVKPEPLSAEARVLSELEERISDLNLTFRVGPTYASQSDLIQITGGLKTHVSPIEAHAQNSLADSLLSADSVFADKIQPPAGPGCSVGSNTWDWRRLGKITPVRKQRCGNCWAYAALSALESSYLIRNNISINGSEQYIVSNNNNSAGDCIKGSAHKALEYLVLRGTTSEEVLPDSGLVGTPNRKLNILFGGMTWAWANPENVGEPGILKIKQAICERGAVTSWIDAGGSFAYYAGGVYNDVDNREPGHKEVGHFVAIIGWDETRKAWLVKNSWGTTWGETADFGTDRGYAWVGYGIHGIGTDVAWTQARRQPRRDAIKIRPTR
jgi:cathepsin L